MIRIDGSDGLRWPLLEPSGLVPAVQATSAALGFADPRPAGPRSGATRVNCFTPGTLIATPRGTAEIETLKPGDMVITRDNGPQEIRWLGRRQLTGAQLRLDTDLHPVQIRAGALGRGLPDHDLRVSPNHRILLLGKHPALDVAEAEVFVSARHLVGTRGIARIAVAEVTYMHFMCDRHEVVLSNGAWTESFRPSDDALQGLSERAREEVFTLFPDLMGAGPTVPVRAARWTFDASAGRKFRA